MKDLLSSAAKGNEGSVSSIGKMKYYELIVYHLLILAISGEDSLFDYWRTGCKDWAPLFYIFYGTEQEWLRFHDWRIFLLVTVTTAKAC